MALNFPSSPSSGDTHNAANGLQYYYDGVKWTSQGSYSTSTINATKLDDISSNFNGSSTGPFNLTSSSVSVKPDSPESVLISVGGVIQEPTTAYTINSTNGTISFTSAPPSGATFWGSVYTRIPVSTTTVTDGGISTVKLAAGAVTSAKLDTNIDIAGTLDVTGNTTLDSNVNIKGDSKTFTIENASGTDKFTVASSTGNTVVVGTLGVTGDVAVNTNKFNVTASSGNTTAAGTLGVTGLTTLSKGFNLPKVSSTLASTALAVTSGWHEITASGNALTTLTGGTAGQLLLITVAGTDLVVTDTAVGGGSNTIVGGVTLDLSEGDTLLLMFDGTQWRKIAHGDN